MEDGQAPSAAWGTTPICRIEVVKASISPSLSAKSRRETYFRKDSHIYKGRTFWGVDLLLVIQDAVFWDVGGDFLRFCQRTDPLVVIELLQGRVLFLSSKTSASLLSPT